MAPYWEYLRWGVYVASALSAWRFVPLAFVRLVAALTQDEARHRHCMEVLRLARRDAARIPSYMSVGSPHKARAKRETSLSVLTPEASVLEARAHQKDD